MTEDDRPEVAIQLINFPPSSAEAEIRPIAFGGALTGPKFSVLLEVDGDEEDDDGPIDITLTLSNAAEHDEIVVFLDDMIELLGTIRDSAGDQITLKLLEQSLLGPDDTASRDSE